MCKRINVVPSIPRRCGRQRHRDNTPAEDPATCYRRTITIPLVDHLLSEMEQRFTPHQKIALLGFSLIPSPLVTLPQPEVKENLAKLVAQYKGDLPSPASVGSQIHSWKIKWQTELQEHGKACLPTSPLEALPHACVKPLP